MDLDVATDVDSLPARVVSYHLRERHGYGTWLAFDEAVFGAPWPDGRNVGGADLPVDLATDAGVAADEVRSALDDDTLREDVRQRFTEARRRGATGVPTFASDGHAARGAVPPERLRRPVEGV
jgi:predicted DsbA family dithiol-disulfide isomerase